MPNRILLSFLGSRHVTLKLKNNDLSGQKIAYDKSCHLNLIFKFYFYLLAMLPVGIVSLVSSYMIVTR